uniref:Uncharacterized protein n=1 Tax=Plectus sambesii TaxID=2011161 RepID=A0A914VD16_9BILA
MVEREKRNELPASERECRSQWDNSDGSLAPLGRQFESPSEEKVGARTAARVNRRANNFCPRVYPSLSPASYFFSSSRCFMPPTPLHWRQLRAFRTRRRSRADAGSF